MPFSRTGTLTGTTTTDTISVTGIDPPVRYVAVRLRGTADTDVATFHVATNGTTATDVTIGGNNFYHLDKNRPEHPVEVGQATSISVKIRGTASAAYVVFGE